MKTAATGDTAPGAPDCYDAVVIGGGIQGAGCAQALAAKGFGVLLLERHSVGSGTSSRSSKLIHGGLRYLETGQFSLVRKSLKERSLLQQLAPDLVELRKFYLPVYRSQRLKQWQLAAGLSLYSLLGGLSIDTRFHKLSKAQYTALNGLRQDKLLGIYQYYDAQTDDLKLTQAVIRSAQTLGCIVSENSLFLSARQNSDGSISVAYQDPSDQTGSMPTTINTKLLINASGPWVAETQKNINFAPGGPAISLVQGAHIELDQQLGENIFYVESPIDQRAVFIMPWRGRTLVGTTETQHTGDPGSCEPHPEEINYLEQTLRHYFPDYGGTLADSWAGLRVLPQPDTTHPLRPFSSQARDTIIHVDSNNRPTVIALYGGKLTAYRVTAEAVCKLALPTLGPALHNGDTATIALG